MQIVDLDPRDHNDLIIELNTNDKWKKLSTYLVEKWGFPREEFIDNIELRGSAPNAELSHAELLWIQLRTQMCDVETLCDWLEECNLLHALYIITGEVKLKITQQPSQYENEEPYEAAMNDTISFTCRATGLPPPSYQWFHEKDELHDKTSSTLTLIATDPTKEGDYWCKVRQYGREGELLHYEDSNCAVLKIKPTAVKIRTQPTLTKVKLGGTLKLSCEAEAHPSPRYQWFKSEDKLDGKTDNTLLIKDKGEYHCMVSNGSDDKYTDRVQVMVDYPRLTATAKIALLIANNKYHHETELKAAENDAALLNGKLSTIGFQVICRQNLNLEEMKSEVKTFCDALKPGAYGLFYFAGHGCMMRNSSYMKPVDTPCKYTADHTFSQDQLLLNIENKELPLFVCILDMCLEDESAKIHKETHETWRSTCTDNLILAYSTSRYNSSFEKKGAKNTLYATVLAENITRNAPACHVFRDTGNSVRKLTTRRTKTQKPTTITATAEPYRYLTDEVITRNA